MAAAHGSMDNRLQKIRAQIGKHVMPYHRITYILQFKISRGKFEPGPGFESPVF